MPVRSSHPGAAAVGRTSLDGNGGPTRVTLRSMCLKLDVAIHEGLRRLLARLRPDRTPEPAPADEVPVDDRSPVGPRG